MDESLRRESEKLVGSWSRHETDWLRDYLVAGVEDPRLNVQSILSRHFLIRSLAGDRFSTLMKEECRFAAAINWVAHFIHRAGDTESLAVLLHALRRLADNAEGTDIPHFISDTFSRLPITCGESVIPNYLEQILTHSVIENGTAKIYEPALNAFQQPWRASLSEVPIGTKDSLVAPNAPLRVIEPACGSANDYRFVHSFGLARHFDYTGFDLAEKNIQNARLLFPGTRFEVANVFEIPAADKSFDLCLAHDLFEHLSLAGLEIAVREICRVTRRALCLGFFQMDEIRDHVVRPIDDYHINLLSADRMRALFRAQGFAAQIIQIATFLRSEFGCDFTHNPYAYTVVLWARV